VLKLRFLPNTTFFITLILAVGFRAHAQFGPVHVRMKFQPIDSLYRFSLQTAQVPDSTRPALMKIKCSFQSRLPELYWAVSNSGAILAFKDSTLEKTLFLEKRNVFPFLQLKSRTKYWMEITRSNGKDGYLAARIQNEHGTAVFDEVFLCLPQTDLRIQTIEIQPESWIFENK
jgi:hypothetical protein